MVSGEFYIHVGVHVCMHMSVESAVAKVVRFWVLEVGQRVVGSNPGRVAMFAFLGKMLNLEYLSPPRSMKGYL